jgi:hypothetical protein
LQAKPPGIPPGGLGSGLDMCAAESSERRGRRKKAQTMSLAGRGTRIPLREDIRLWKSGSVCEL